MSHNILIELDSHAKARSFPNLNNSYIYLSGSRMNIYADDNNWAIIFEILGYFYKLYSNLGFCNYLYGFFGSKSSHDCTFKRQMLSHVDNGTSVPILSDGIHVNPGLSNITVREQLHSVSLDPGYFMAAGVTPKDPERIHAAELMRAISHYYANDLFATESEIFNLTQLSIPKLLCLTEWRHPDLDCHELPSHLQTFHDIVTVIYTSQASSYSYADIPNTHWSNWPRSGTL